MYDVQSDDPCPVGRSLKEFFWQYARILAKEILNISDILSAQPCQNSFKKSTTIGHWFSKNKSLKNIKFSVSRSFKKF